MMFLFAIIVASSNNIRTVITRIVKLTFQPQHNDDFIKMYDSKRERIAQFEGCTGVKLLRDTADHNVFFTYSTWDSVAHLDAYRESEFFVSTWAVVKTWFSEKPQAWSVGEVEL